MNSTNTTSSVNYAALKELTEISQTNGDYDFIPCEYRHKGSSELGLDKLTEKVNTLELYITRLDDKLSPFKKKSDLVKSCTSGSKKEESKSKYKEEIDILTKRINCLCDKVSQIYSSLDFK